MVCFIDDEIYFGTFIDFLMGCDALIDLTGYYLVNPPDIQKGVPYIQNISFSLSHLSRWHPMAVGPCGDFHRLFWKPPVPEEAFLSSSLRRQDRYC